MDAAPQARLAGISTCDAADRLTGTRGRRGVRLAVVMAAVLASGAAISWLHERPQDVYRQGLAELDRGRIIRAEARLRALRRFPDGERYQHVLHAGLLMQHGRHNDALDQLRKIEPADDVRVHALIVAGECLYELGRLDEAANVFRQLADEDPLNTTGRRWLAAIHYDEGRLDEALRQLQELTGMQPDDYSSHVLMGQIQHQDLHNHVAAEVHFRDALARHPPRQKRRSTTIELARTLIEQGKHPAALRILHDLKQDALVLALQAYCCWHTGDRDAARSTLARAFVESADQRDALMLQARISVDEGRTQAAIAPLQRVLKTDPHDFPCLYQLALVYRRLGDDASAESYMRRMQQSREFRTQLAELFVQARRPDDAAVREQIAELCQKNDQPEMATMWRAAAEASRRTDPTIQLGPEWYSSLNQQ